MSTFRTKTILIADDDEGHRLLTEAALAGAGYVVITAHDGAQAVTEFAASHPDMVILDVMMPNMTGIEACQAIRQRPDGQNLPVLMLTGRNDLAAISDAYAAGASDFAQKGLNPRLLVERVRFLLRDQELQNDVWSSRSKLLLAQRIARVGHWELDLEGRTVSLSPMAAVLLAVDSGSLQDYEHFVTRLDPTERDAVREAFRGCAAGAGAFSFDHRLHVARGVELCLHQEGELVQSQSAADRGVVIVTLQDLTRLRDAEENVHRLSYFDTATGLHNRRHLVERITEALADADTLASTVGIVAIRLHNLDRLLQAHGAQFVSALVTEVGKGVQDELTRMGLCGYIAWQEGLDTVCRIADGELAMLLRSRGSPQQLAEVTRGVLAYISHPIMCLGTEYAPAVSAGIALAPKDGDDAERLLTSAHGAAHAATDVRSYEFFSTAQGARSRVRVQMESALRSAIERRELRLAFQPRVTIETLDLTGVECLLRWEHPQFGSVSPEEFVSIAEETGLIDQIGQWVIKEACRQLADWREGFKGKFFVSVKLSGRQLRDRHLVSSIKDILAATGLPGDALELQVREVSLIDAPKETRDMLTALRSVGVRVAIDDFGTGYSSLGLIRRMPFDCMKLDRSLIADLYSDLGATGVTAAVVAMARALRICSVAEGIEDAATLDMIRSVGCDEIQGFYVSRPLSAGDFEQWLTAGGAAALRVRETMILDAGLEAEDSRPLNIGRGGG
jgi:EAL domain-containing protein (putative c-di-GMP-specific phosphodiesterase class I)/DNA-binding response OmpR family regulator/GGDEF domain-containing protein